MFKNMLMYLNKKVTYNNWRHKNNIAYGSNMPKFFDSYTDSNNNSELLQAECCWMYWKMKN